jgi:hypothetical protein
VIGFDGEVAPGVNVPWPGAMLPPWFLQTNVAVTSAVIVDEAGSPPRPAILPEQLRAPELVTLHVGVPTKCGFVANATVEIAATTPKTAAIRRFRNRMLLLPSVVGRIHPPRPRGRFARDDPGVLRR